MTKSIQIKISKYEMEEILSKYIKSHLGKDIDIQHLEALVRRDDNVGEKDKNKKLKNIANQWVHLHDDVSGGEIEIFVEYTRE